MIRPRALAVIGVLALAACADIPVEPSAPEGLRRHDVPLLAAQADGPGTYILSFKNERLPDDLATTVATSGGELLFAHEETGIAIVSGVEAAGLATLASHRELEDIDADAYMELKRPIRTVAKSKMAKNPADAPFYFLQWYLDVVRAPAAWDRGRLGSGNVQIGILDTGIDYLSPEFAGILDLELSKAFIMEPADVVTDPEALKIADYNGHGSIVASVAATNAIFTAGVTSKTELVALKVCNGLAIPQCPIGSTLAAVLYAAKHRLEVINLSLEGELKRKGKEARMDRALRRIIEKVFHYAERRGVTIVVAAGNSGVDMNAERDKVRLYCEIRSVICVSATGPTSENPDGTFANVDDRGQDCGFDPVNQVFVCFPYSNFGKSVTVAAPGGSIYQLPNGNFGFALIFGVCSSFVPGCADMLAASIGTSVAAPQVSALAALLVEDLGRHPDRIAARIKSTADDIGPSGRDPYFGHGRINIERALTQRGRQYANRNNDDDDSDSDN